MIGLLKTPKALAAWLISGLFLIHVLAPSFHYALHHNADHCHQEYSEHHHQKHDQHAEKETEHFALTDLTLSAEPCVFCLNLQVQSTQIHATSGALKSNLNHSNINHLNSQTHNQSLPILKIAPKNSPPINFFTA